MDKNILILNTGGTFNKVYDEIKGILTVPNCTIKGLMYKDSLEIIKQDRQLLLDKTVKFLAKYVKNKTLGIFECQK